MTPEKVVPLIFVTDDNIEILKLVEKRLSQEDYTQVKTFKSYEEMEQVLSLKPDIIVLDNYLSKFQEEEIGLKNFQKIKKQLPHTKVIILSGETDPEIISAFNREGVFGYIIKDSASMEKLIASINSICSGPEFKQSRP